MIDTPNRQLTVNSSPLNAIALSVTTRLVGLAGAWLVGKGYADQGTISAATPELVGGILALASVGWGWYRARHLNNKQNDLAVANPEDVTVN